MSQPETRTPPFDLGRIDTAGNGGRDAHPITIKALTVSVVEIGALA